MQIFVIDLRAISELRMRVTRALLLGSGQCVQKLLTVIPGRDIEFQHQFEIGFGDIVFARLPRKNEPAKQTFVSGAEGVGRVRAKLLLDAIAVLKNKFDQEAKSGGKGHAGHLFPHSLGARKYYAVTHV